MLRAGERLLGLINELLDLARIDAGQLSLQAQAVDLAPLLHECLQTIAPLAQLHGVQLPQAPLLQGRVRADRERLKQVLLNLLSNAIKHNRPGGRVSVQAERDGDTWCISVSDTGPGLDAAQQERLFHAFERLGAGRTGVDGAGIGLALSKRLVELMHGQIGLDSEIGVGSRFWVRLQAAEAVPEPKGCDGTVLYIEDNTVNVLLMQAMLAQQTRLHMLSAETPEAGLQIARTQRPDLILLDIQLPGIDGYEVLRRLRAEDTTRDIPVIAVSANALRADIERGRAAGFDDYLTKPIDQRVLVDALKRVVPQAPDQQVVVRHEGADALGLQLAAQRDAHQATASAVACGTSASTWRGPTSCSERRRPSRSRIRPLARSSGCAASASASACRSTACSNSRLRLSNSAEVVDGDARAAPAARRRASRRGAGRRRRQAAGHSVGADARAGVAHRARRRSSSRGAAPALGQQVGLVEQQQVGLLQLLAHQLADIAVGGAFAHGLGIGQHQHRIECRRSAGQACAPPRQAARRRWFR